MDSGQTASNSMQTQRSSSLVSLSAIAPVENIASITVHSPYLTRVAKTGESAFHVCVGVDGLQLSATSVTRYDDIVELHDPIDGIPTVTRLQA